MNRLLLASLTTLILSFIGGCGDSVPNVEDPRSIIVDGKPMEAMAFIEKYCLDKTDHATCVRVRHAVVTDSTRSKNGPPRF